ncbi:DUF58 domain-containing protein [Luteimonas yindakuii]|uniref:DUF58 domain-containing protein n=1 Tax=Luteimonas yindakuii TaxID=2565782 RepID=UPI0011078D47|nr:DUF58 domain-containing protein [Luteimonas yindakuii]QCU72423.1 DUF58 domain-containing protein [Luteimonas yindakuii]
MKQHDIPSGDAGVVPTLAELVALRASAQGRRPRRVRHASAGQSPSLLRGRGMEYAESREYTAGDDARHIDWRLTARTGRAHTKLFQAERERLSLVVADTAPALYFGTRVRFKSVQAARAGAVAAWRAIGEGDRIAALRGSLREPPVPPAGGARGALRVLDALVRWYARPPDDDAGLATALDHAARVLRPGARLLVLADVGSLDGIPRSRWTGLSLHAEVTVVLLTDPLETAPPQARLAFEAEGRRIDLDLAAAAQRQRWHARFVAPVEAMLAELPGRGVQVRTLASNMPSDAWLQPRLPAVLES